MYKVDNKNDLNFIDRFLYKLFFCFIILFVVVVLGKINVINYNELKTTMSEQINILDIVDKICGNSNFFKINYDYEKEVSQDVFTDITKTSDGYLINLGTYEAVEAIKCGVVVKIEENEDKTYLVHIKGKDGNDYYYNNLSSINVHIYEVLEGKDIVGNGNYNDECLEYTYFFSVYNNGKKIDYYS